MGPLGIAHRALAFWWTPLALCRHPTYRISPKVLTIGPIRKGRRQIAVVSGGRWISSQKPDNDFEGKVTSTYFERSSTGKAEPAKWKTIIRQVMQ